MLCETLAAAGYHHSEISNFGQPGYEAVHNSAYWKHIPYIGLGPGAHSFVSSGLDAGILRREAAPEYKRLWNEGNLNEYLKAGETGDFTSVSGGETLDQEQLMMEKIMLGLRTSAGLQESVLRECCDTASLDRALAAGDLVHLPDGAVRIPESRFFISDNIISSII